MFEPLFGGFPSIPQITHLILSYSLLNLERAYHMLGIKQSKTYTPEIQSGVYNQLYLLDIP